MKQACQLASPLFQQPGFAFSRRGLSFRVANELAGASVHRVEPLTPSVKLIELKVFVEI
jgi:hypothetical protein